MNNERFILNDLPDGSWSVVWNPDHWVNGIYKLSSVVRLLGILFNDIKVDEAILAVDRGRGVHDSILYIKQTAYYETNGKVAEWLDDYIIRGVKFKELAQAEAFKDHLEKLYLTKLLKANYNEENF